MNPTEIEFALRDLVAKPYDPETFVFDFVGLYNIPKSTVSKLKSSQTNAAKASGDVLWKKHLFFRSLPEGQDVGLVADEIANDPLTLKHKPRFLFVTDGVRVHMRDLTLKDTCNADFLTLDEHSDFLLPLAGFERRAVVVEHEADKNAAKRLKKLYDAILAGNPEWNDGNHAHELNQFMTRALFCFYAEDTGIFPVKQMFTNTVTQHTQEDGSDLGPLLDRLFRVMNLKKSERPAGLSKTESQFPYVNGSLFEAALPIPAFNRLACLLFIECGDLDWTTINPDIFGSMIQTIAHSDTRSDLGMHYTSVPNIMKVLQPLFLDDLEEAYEKAQNSVPKLGALLGRLSKIRVFDPACGSGNFLIIAYKALRRLEMRVIARIEEISPKQALSISGVHLQNFYGIDLVDFACETAKLSLWIAEYQMNSDFKEEFGNAREALPLGKISTIHCDNATRLDWLKVCPKDDSAETYICGNPPYIGASSQTQEQRKDAIAIFGPILNGGSKVDYVACWFILLSNYIAKTTQSFGVLVATNSICQGEQVAFLWPYIFRSKMCITFAHTSFKWSNNASHNAGVTCVIVGIGKETSGLKRLYSGSYCNRVSNINAYLVPSASNLIVEKSQGPLNGLPEASLGDRPADGGNLILSPVEKRQIENLYPHASSLIRRFYGSRDFIENIERYALWISDDDLALAKSVPPIVKRLQQVAHVRKNGGRDGQRTYLTPHRFGYTRHQEIPALILPEISSERRDYLQVGLISSSEIAANTVYVIYSPPSHLLALLSSRLHRIWAQTVGGKLEDRLRYSNGLVYNTFPVPDLSTEQKRILGTHSKAIIQARGKHPGKTIAWLYNPETMPANLLQAHQENDAYLEEHVYGRKFKDDTHRLEHLFTMYAAMKERVDRDELPLFAEVEAKPKKKAKS